MPNSKNILRNINIFLNPYPIIHELPERSHKLIHVNGNVDKYSALKASGILKLNWQKPGVLGFSMLVWTKGWLGDVFVPIKSFDSILFTTNKGYDV